jgi:hypothetical protein
VNEELSEPRSKTLCYFYAMEIRVVYLFEGFFYKTPLVVQNRFLSEGKREVEDLRKAYLANIPASVNWKVMLIRLGISSLFFSLNKINEKGYPSRYFCQSHNNVYVF